MNEIDVRNVAKGQPVVITLDADPTKKLKGTVVAVANVGEQRPNADAKVFEVKVTVEQPDTTLRPGMTTGNAVRTYLQRNALFVPMEAVVSDSGRSYVYKRDGSRTVKQQVQIGAFNDNEIVIERGLAENDRVLLSPPVGKEQLKVLSLPALAKPARPSGRDTTPKPRKASGKDPTAPPAASSTAR